MKKYTLANWFEGKPPSLLAIMFLWIWKRNKITMSVILIPLCILSVIVPLGWFILLMKKIGFILALPIFIYLYIKWIKYFIYSAYDARKIYNKK